MQMMSFIMTSTRKSFHAQSLLPDLQRSKDTRVDPTQNMFRNNAVSAYRKPAFQPSAFRRLFIGFQPSAENQPISMENSLSM